MKHFLRIMMRVRDFVWFLVFGVILTIVVSKTPLGDMVIQHFERGETYPAEKAIGPIFSIIFGAAILTALVWWLREKLSPSH